MSRKAVGKTNPHIGTDFDDFLREEGVYKQAHAVAVNRVLARELERDLQKAQVRMTNMASLVDPLVTEKPG
jgi:antitoxin HicB